MKEVNVAVYYVAIGKEALSCLQDSLLSLRKNKFSGDVYILTDEPTLPFSVGTNTYIRVLTQKDFNLDQESNESTLSVFDIRRLNTLNKRNVKMGRKFTICHAKALAPNYIPFEKYTHIVYLDSDILIGKDFLEVINYINSNPERIIVSESRTRYLGGKYPLFLSKAWFREQTRTANLSRWELFRFWHVRPICADIVCIPVSVSQSFFTHWRTECQKGIDSDQAALQAILLRNYKSMYKLAPKSLFGYGLSNIDYAKGKNSQYVDSVCIHFHGALRDPSAMKQYLNEYINI